MQKMGLYGREITYEPEELKAAGLGFTKDFTFLGLIGMKNLWDLLDLWIFFQVTNVSKSLIKILRKKKNSFSVFAKNYLLTKNFGQKKN